MTLTGFVLTLGAAFMCKDWPWSFSNCRVSAAAMTRLLSWRIPKILIASRMERTQPDNP